MSATSMEMEWKGRTGPFSILINPGVFSPTHTSRTIAEALEIGPRDTVIDVGCGSGVLSFVAARLGAKRVIGCDISEEAVEAASRNAARLGLDDRVEFRAGSLLDGGPTGAELPRMMLESIGDTLAPGGRLYLPTGTIQDERSILEAAHRVFGDNMESVIEREFPLPDIVGRSVAVARMMKEGLLNLHRRGSRWLWRLQIWRCIRT
jgi:16S rRNA G1207 methylase RsmC